MSAGGEHTCARRASGEIVCWGANGNGQTDAPQATFHSVSAGELHSCAVRQSTGLGYCWGRTLTWHAVSRVLARMSAGDTHACGLRGEGGGVLCWGSGFRADAFLEGSQPQVSERGLVHLRASNVWAD